MEKYFSAKNLIYKIQVITFHNHHSCLFLSRSRFLFLYIKHKTFFKKQKIYCVSKGQDNGLCDAIVENLVHTYTKFSPLACDCVLSQIKFLYITQSLSIIQIQFFSINAQPMYSVHTQYLKLEKSKSCILFLFSFIVHGTCSIM